MTHGSQNNPETPSDAPMADAAKSHTSATLPCSFYRSRYLFLPFSNGRGVRLSQNNPETPSDAPMADAAKSHTSATLPCSFYRSRYLFLPFSNGRGVRLAI